MNFTRDLPVIDREDCDIKNRKTDRDDVMAKNEARTNHEMAERFASLLDCIIPSIPLSGRYFFLNVVRICEVITDKP